MKIGTALSLLPEKAVIIQLKNIINHGNKQYAFFFFNSMLLIYYFFFWSHCIGYRILVPQSGIELMPPAVET